MPPKKKAASSSDSDSGPEDRTPAKKSKTDSSTKTTGDDGEASWQLDKMRFVKVSEFKGRKMVNIREYYEKDGKVLPGKRGIALSAAQWKKLVDASAEITKEMDN